jgi:predicted MFS family arabinose efflux permease
MAGRHIAELGLPNSLLIGLAISASGVMLTLVPTLWTVIAGLIIFSCGVFICQSIIMTSIGACVSEGRSLAMGIFNLIYYAGGATSTLLVGLPYQRFGWPAAILSIVVIQISAGSIAYLTWRKRAQSM